MVTKKLCVAVSNYLIKHDIVVVFAFNEPLIFYYNNIPSTVGIKFLTKIAIGILKENFYNTLITLAQTYDVLCVVGYADPPIKDLQNIRKDDSSMQLSHKQTIGQMIVKNNNILIDEKKNN